MNFQVTREQLLAAINPISSLALRPVALVDRGRGRLRFTSTSEGIKLTAADADIQATTHLAVDVSGEGSWIVPSKPVFNMLRDLDDGTELTLAFGDGRLLMSHKTGRYLFNTLPGIDFREIDGALKPGARTTKVRIETDTLQSLLLKCAGSASHDANREVIMSVLLHGVKGKLVAVSTDGTRMTLARAEVDGFDDAKLLLPAKLVNALLGLLKKAGAGDKLGIEWNKSAIRIETDDTTVDGLLMNAARYPAYEKVIPRWEAGIVVERQWLLEAAERAKIVAEHNLTPVKLMIEQGSLGVHGVGLEGALESTESIECAFTGDSVGVHFNADLLIDTIRTSEADEEGNVAIEFKTNVDAFVIRSPKQGRVLQVLMPLRMYMC